MASPQPSQSIRLPWQTGMAMDRLTPMDLQKLLVIRPVDIVSITPDTGAVVMAEEPSEFETILIVYNDIGPLDPEIGIRLPGDRRDAITLKDAPIKDNNGDGRVTKADVNLQFAEAQGRSDIIAFNADVGAITLVEPPIPGQLVAVSYNYSNPVTIFQYDRALGTDFYWDWAFWRPSLFRTTFEITLWITMGMSRHRLPCGVLPGECFKPVAIHSDSFSSDTPVDKPFWSALLPGR